MRKDFFLAAMAVMAASAATAQTNAGAPTTLVCATLQATACSPGACTAGPPGDFGVPQFVKLDLTAMTLQATRPNGETVDSSIAQQTRAEGQLVLQGVEDGRGWTLSINEATGRMVASITTDADVFVVFGACTSL